MFFRNKNLFKKYFFIFDLNKILIIKIIKNENTYYLQKMKIIKSVIDKINFTKTLIFLIFSLIILKKSCIIKLILPHNFIILEVNIKNKN